MRVLENTIYRDMTSEEITQAQTETEQAEREDWLSIP